MIKNLPANSEMWVPSLGWEDPLEEEMTLQFIIFCLENPIDRSLAGYHPWVCKGLDTTEAT